MGSVCPNLEVVPASHEVFVDILDLDGDLLKGITKRKWDGTRKGDEGSVLSKGHIYAIHDIHRKGLKSRKSHER